MNIAYPNSNDFSFFSGAQEQREPLIHQLQSEHYEESEHGEIEKFIDQDGREILRRLLQGWLVLSFDGKGMAQVATVYRVPRF